MNKFKDLSGQVFGRWTVREHKGYDKWGKALWECLCECGNTGIVTGYSLLRGDTKSCGCLKRQLLSERRFKNLTGKTFERLIAQEHKGFDKWGNALWECLCECGNTTVVTGHSLLCGNTKSCGCLQQQRASEASFKNLAGKVFERWTVQEHKGFDKRGKALWECLCECGNTAIVTSGSLLGGHSKSCGCLQKEKASARKGPLSNLWKGGITPENEQIRASSEYLAWRKAVFKRDKYTCQFCGQGGGSLQAHHIKSFSKHTDLRFNLDNGLTLCKSCHRKIKR